MLKPLRILVTRPQPAAMATAARLEALGHHPILLPVMQAAHQPRAALSALSLPHTALAVTSAQAVHALAPNRAELLPHLDTPIFCVGQATAQAAADLGFRTVIAGPGTGKGLARLVIETQTATKSPVSLIYLARLPRSPDFEDMLQQAGIACRAVEVYGMSPIPRAPGEVANLFETRRPDTILFYSQETASRFFTLCGQENDLENPSMFRGIRMLCLSDHVAAAIPPGHPVAVAAEPSEDSLFSLL